MSLKIHQTNLSPPVRAVLMTAEILKLDYEAIEVSLMAGEHRTPEYVEKNPLQTVPLLEDGDFFLADSHSIVTYLISKYGGEKQKELYPNDLQLRATIDQRMFFDAATLFRALRSITIALLMEGAPGPSPQQIEDIHAGYDVVEKYLQKTKFLACDHLTVADVSCVAVISSLNVTVPIDAKYKKLHAWWDGLKAKEWYKTKNLPGLAVYEGFVKSLMKKNSESA